MDAFYEIAFKFKDKWFYTRTEYDTHAYAQGFWINKEMEWTVAGSDCKYWITPANIMYIEKIKISKNFN